jgi:PhzF family phenazine biosynthesis protein
MFPLFNGKIIKYTDMKIYQIDAFTNELFKGNPAAVVPLESWLPTDIMQKIAAENNLAETAFFVLENGQYHIKWFTPTVEIELCGHATLASAYVIYEYLGYTDNEIRFTCMVGELLVRKENDFIVLNFPADGGETVRDTADLSKIMRLDILNARVGRTKFLFEVASEEMIRNYRPDFTEIKKIDKQVIITAKGNEVDFVSRFFAPNSGVDEDPVTGSAHCVLIPFWAEKLGKTELTARQLSERTGFLKCRHLGERVEMAGQAVCYLIGEIFI